MTLKDKYAELDADTDSWLYDLNESPLAVLVLFAIAGICVVAFFAFK